MSLNFRMILVILTILNTIFLIAFGFWVPYVKCLLWLTSVIGAILSTIILLEFFHLIFKHFTGIAEMVFVHFHTNLMWQTKSIQLHIFFKF